MDLHRVSVGSPVGEQNVYGHERCILVLLESSGDLLRKELSHVFFWNITRFYLVRYEFNEFGWIRTCTWSVDFGLDNVIAVLNVGPPVWHLRYTYLTILTLPVNIELVDHVPLDHCAEDQIGTLIIQ